MAFAKYIQPVMAAPCRCTAHFASQAMALRGILKPPLTVKLRTRQCRPQARVRGEAGLSLQVSQSRGNSQQPWAGAWERLQNTLLWRGAFDQVLDRWV